MAPLKPSLRTGPREHHNYLLIIHFNPRNRADSACSPSVISHPLRIRLPFNNPRLTASRSFAALGHVARRRTLESALLQLGYRPC
jgi:hypothetical protein